MVPVVISPVVSYDSSGKSFTILSHEARKNLSDIFKDFPGLIIKIQGLSRTAKNPKLFQD